MSWNLDCCLTTERPISRNICTKAFVFIVYYCDVRNELLFSRLIWNKTFTVWYDIVVTPSCLNQRILCQKQNCVWIMFMRVCRRENNAISKQIHVQWISSPRELFLQCLVFSSKRISYLEWSLIGSSFCRVPMLWIFTVLMTKKRSGGWYWKKITPKLTHSILYFHVFCWKNKKRSRLIAQHRYYTEHYNRLNAV